MSAKPIITWVGGKSRLLKHINPYIPDVMNNYIEPFVGGGAMLINILNRRDKGEIKIEGKIKASDMNKHLINVYNHIRDYPEELFNKTNQYDTIIRSINISHLEKGKRKKKDISEEEKLTSQEHFFYYLRDKFNKNDKDTLEAAGLFVILIRMAFRSLYAEKDNKLNVSFCGTVEKQGKLYKDNFIKLSKLFKDVIFEVKDYKEALKDIEMNDFIYLDPPYYPLNENSYTKYTAEDFGPEQGEELFEELLSIKKASFLMSNSGADRVKEVFKYSNIKELDIKYNLNYKQDAKKEILVYNYYVDEGPVKVGII